MLREIRLMVFGIVLFVLAVNLTDHRTTANPASPNAAEPTRIALIDLAKIFKTSKYFERQREQLKRSIVEVEAEAKRTVADIETLKKLLTKYEKDSDDARVLDAEIQRKSAEFEEFRKSTQKKILNEESAIYRKTSQLMETTAADYAKQHGFDLVLRFSSEAVDEQDPRKLIQSMNVKLIFHRELDITDQIIKLVDERN